MLILSVNWPHVWLITIVGFVMVFVLLVVLILLMNVFGVVMKPRVKAPKPKEARDSGVAVQQRIKSEGITLTGNAMAAIAMSLHLYYSGVHDEEPSSVTTKKVDRRYSPWSSKIYGINNLHR